MPKIPNWYKLKHEAKSKCDLKDTFFIRENGKIYKYLPTSAANISAWVDFRQPINLKPLDRTYKNSFAQYSATCSKANWGTVDWCETTNWIDVTAGGNEYVQMLNNSSTGMEDNKKFTISIWFYLDGLSAVSFVTKKEQYSLYMDASGTFLYPSVYDGVWNNLSQRFDFYDGITALTTSTWHHLVFTYNGTSTSVDIDNNAGMKCYLNGKRLNAAGVPAGASFVSIKTSSENVTFGAGDVGGGLTNYINGRMAEAAIWQNRILEDQEVKAIYNGVLSCVYKPMSGFISNPPRYNIRQWDAATGSYPTIARTGDASRLGNYKTSFNDTNTVVFEDPYATATVNFDMTYETKLIPASEPGIFYSNVGNAAGLKTVINPTIDELSLSPREGDVIELIDSKGSIVSFTFKSKPITAADVALPANKYDRYQLALNFTDIVNKAPDLNIYASIVSEPKQQRLDAGEILANGTVMLKQQTAGTAGNTTITSTMALPPFFASPEGIAVSSTFNGGKDINVNYSTLLQAGAPQRLIKQAYASPNILDNSLDNSGGIVRKGIADSHLRFTPGEDLTAFNDSRIDSRINSFFNEGTPEDIYPGFSYPLKSKTQIEISLPNTAEEYLVKNVKSKSDAVDASGYFAGKNKTGFLYYNFDTSRWDQIGLTDQVTGTNVTFDWALSIDNNPPTPPNDKIISGTNNFPQQFYPPRQLADSNASTKEGRNAFAYQNVGLPIINSFAPYGTKYHATSSQCMRMSNYITSPFLLEKMTVEVPYVARRTNDGTLTGRTSPTESWLDRQQMLNFTFFAYKQRNFVPPGAKTDSAQDVTGSQRNLVISGGMCFYNRNYTGAAGNPYTSFDPTHNPAFKYDFNESIGSSYTAVVTGSAFLELIPAITTAQIVGFTQLPSSSVSYDTDLDDTATKTCPLNPSFTAYWPGGTTFKDFGELEFTGKSSAGGYPAYSGSSTDLMSSAMTNDASINSFRIAFSNTTNVITTDSRPMKASYGGEITKLRESNDIILVGDRTSVSPYLLFPEDELIFGWDTGVSIAGRMKCINELTGSYMKLRSDLPVKITMYGSQVRDKVEFHDTLNQPLTSDAIHEAIHYDNPVTDQFQIAPRSEYVGTYLDDFNKDFSGIAISSPVARIGKEIQSMINESAGEANESFTRYTQSFNLSEVFYDSLLPEVDAIFSKTCDPITNEIFSLTFSRYGSALASSLKELTYPFPLRSEGQQSAWEPKRSYQVVNKQYYGPTSLISSLVNNTIPYGWLTTTAYGAELGVVGPIGWAKKHEMPTPCTSYDPAGPVSPNTVDLQNFSFTYDVYDPASITNTQIIVAPYKDNPKRHDSTKSQHSILISKLSVVNVREPADGPPYYTISKTGGYTNNAADDSIALLQAISPHVEYISGKNLAKVLYGATKRNSSDQYFITNNTQNPLAHNNGVVVETDPRTILFDVIDRFGNYTATLNNVTTSGSFSLSSKHRQLSYGLINTSKQNNKVYFRSDRYTGQLADTVHTGYDTAFSGLIMMSLFSPDSESVNHLAAVVVNFVSGSTSTPEQNLSMRSYARITPMQIMAAPRSQSSNLSIYATSSMPYFDDDIARNRTYSS